MAADDYVSDIGQDFILKGGDYVSYISFLFNMEDDDHVNDIDPLSSI